MLGTGFGFSILPTLRRVYRDDPKGFAEALNRHSEHFNAHPYLANLALGAACRMEMDGKAPEEIRRFKLAVRGPLGSLGDSLVWAGWRPATVLMALVLALAGASPGATVLFFLLTYNLGHLLLRVGGFAVGLERGSQVGDSLRKMSLPLQADRLAGIGVFFLGGVLGLVIGRSWGFGIQVLPWGVMVTMGLFLGSRLGQGSWRWILWTVSGLSGAIFLIGWFG
jgi:mannose/fructose/N-acetylgalactosamine-specific phosphotransferase system component IID